MDRIQDLPEERDAEMPEWTNKSQILATDTRNQIFNILKESDIIRIPPWGLKKPRYLEIRTEADNHI